MGLGFESQRNHERKTASQSIERRFCRLIGFFPTNIYTSKSLAIRIRRGNGCFTSTSATKIACHSTKRSNKGLKDVGEAIGVDGLTFYAARHSWATIARTPREEGGAGLDKYVIHEALNHVDTSMKVTDIYLVKNWRVIFDANKAVMNLFDWSGIGK